MATTPSFHPKYPLPIAVLVGAGPGDIGLFTLAGARTLALASVVIYDALANPDLLAFCSPEAELIYVGKRAGLHSFTQPEINAMLVEKCREYMARPDCPSRCVVRLKGGDPFVFGRGGEEAQALTQAQIPFAVIPGITAGIAGPAYAGIPVTHRDFTSTVTFITGHQQEDSSDKSSAAPSGDESSNLDYPALAKLGGTLVFYMGVRNLPHITQRLMDCGLNADTPAAVVRMATHPEQQTVAGTVKTIAQLAQKAEIKAPAITIIGKVVSVREQMNWFESRPLFGQTILVTRTRQQASTLSDKLLELGARVIEAPTIEIAKPTDRQAALTAIQDMTNYDCVVFTSANGVQSAHQAMIALELDARDFAATVAAIGPATADALNSIGITPDIVSTDAISEELALELINYFSRIDPAKEPDAAKLDLSGYRFLLLRAEIARPSLVKMLRNAGAAVDDVPIYQTRIPESLPENAIEALENGTVDWITFTSASTAKNLFTMLPENLRSVVGKCRRLSIGPTTSRALAELGWPATLEAQHHDIPGMVDAMVEENLRGAGAGAS